MAFTVWVAKTVFAKKQHKYLQVCKKELPLRTVQMRLWCNW